MFVGFVGLAVDVLSLWQLALVIKASLQSIHNGQSKESLYLYENSFLQCLSHLASLGTGLSNSLLVRDLEVSKSCSCMQTSVKDFATDIIATEVTY